MDNNKEKKKYAQKPMKSPKPGRNIQIITSAGINGSGNIMNVEN